MKSRASRRGFTLIELMIVVAIVGILAVLGVVSYRKLVIASHVSEGTGMVQAVRLAQESYYQEAGAYASVDTSVGLAGCPVHSGTTPTKVPWNPACPSTGTVTWQALTVHADAPTLFGLSTQAGRAGAATLPTVGAASCPGAPTFTAPTKDWYIVSAVGYTGGTKPSCILGVSWTNDVAVISDGS